MIINGGEELHASLLMLINELVKLMIIPEECKKMTIKSISKKKGNSYEMDDRRGLFLTSIVSKFMEKLLNMG